MENDICIYFMFEMFKDIMYIYQANQIVIV